MIYIWLKAIKDHKIVEQKTLKVFQPYSQELLETMIKTLLEQMDLPAPVFLTSHFLNFEKYKSAKFLKRDFVEQIHFDAIDVVDIDV